MTIEPFTPGDLPVLDALRPDKWPDLDPPYRFYLSHRFCFPLKAVVDGAVAGIGTGIAFAATGWLAHITVRPECRGRGIGGLIVGALLDLLAARGCRTASLLATDLGHPVYAKHGFRDQAEYAFFTREEGERSVRDAAAIVPCLPEAHGEAVLELDRAISGEARGDVIREYLEGGFVHVAGGKVGGYYLPRLGEGLIGAHEREAGLALLAAKTARAVRVVLPAANEAGIRFLTENGYKETMRCRRMVRGPAFPWKPDSVYGRIGGNLG